MSNFKPIQEGQLVYDWNLVDTRRPIARGGKVLMFDETLRDGIQSPSVIDPEIGDKLRLIHLMDQLGIHSADIGLPGAGKRAQEDVTRITEEIRDAKLAIKPGCAARTVIRDIEPVAAISQKTGVELEVLAFLGSSPIRQYAEGWDLDRMLKMSGDAIRFAVQEGLPVSFVTEDTIRSRPDTLFQLFKNAIECGATRLVLCDTVGHATPDGVRALTKFAESVIDSIGMRGHVALDWHGHGDRGLAVVNALVALESGCERLHGTGLGIGERVGNASMDQLLLNLRLLGVLDNDLTHLTEYCRLIGASTGMGIPINYPVVGRDAFRTATGVHAAAIIKAHKKGDEWLADRIYSGVPASMVGRNQTIEVGHMSGTSNAVFWLQKRGIEPTDALVAAVMTLAKASNKTLTEAQIMSLVSPK